MWWHDVQEMVSRLRRNPDELLKCTAEQLENIRKEWEELQNHLVEHEKQLYGKYLSVSGVHIKCAVLM